MLSFKTTLRIYSQELSLGEIDDKLGALHTSGVSVGDRYSNGSKVRSQTHWGRSSEGRAARDELDKHLSDILDFVKERREALRELEDLGCSISVSCLVDSDNGQGSLSLSAEIMYDLAACGLELFMDFYSD